MSIPFDLTASLWGRCYAWCRDGETEAQRGHPDPKFDAFILYLPRHRLISLDICWLVTSLLVHIPIQQMYTETLLCAKTPPGSWVCSDEQKRLGCCPQEASGHWSQLHWFLTQQCLTHHQGWETPLQTAFWKLIMIRSSIKSLESIIPAFLIFCSSESLLIILWQTHFKQWFSTV